MFVCPENSQLYLPHRCRTQLLKLAVPLVKQHGFTRTALARSVLALPEPHPAPLPDSAVTTLFGEGDTARRTLISAWLEQGRTHMRSVPVEDVKGALLSRLEYNVPVLEHLPEVPCTYMRFLAYSCLCTR
jgi:ubiquinone biosynthesis protein COQ9